MTRCDHLGEHVVHLMREASERYILPLYNRLSSSDVEQKAPLDYVTVADRQVEDFLRPRLQALLEGSVFVGEESAFADPAILGLLEDDLVWLIDPLDGTRNFVEGRPDFAVMVCLLFKGVAQGAWIYFPVLDKLIAASAGQGVTINGVAAPLLVTTGTETTGIVVHSGMPDEVSHLLARSMSVTGPARQELYSAAADCLAILEGRVGFALYWRTLPWDHAPCCLALVEAGGSCQRLDGADYGPSDGKNGLVVSMSTPITERLAGWMYAELH